MAEGFNSDDFFNKMTESFTSAISNSSLGSKLDTIIQGQNKLLGIGEDISTGKGKKQKSITTNTGGISSQLSSLNQNISALHTVIEGLSKELKNITHSTKASSAKQSTKVSSTKQKIINKTDLTPIELTESLIDSLFEGLVKGEQDASSFIKQINTSRNKIKGELSQKTIKNEKEAEQRAKETEKQAKQYAENVMQGYITPHLALPYNPNVKPTLSNNEGGYAKPIGYKNEIEGQNKKSKSAKQKINRAKELEKGGILPSETAVIVGGEVLSNTAFKEFRSKSKQEDKEEQKKRKMIAQGILSFLPDGGGLNNIFRMTGKGSPLIATAVVAISGILKVMSPLIERIKEAVDDINRTSSAVLLATLAQSGKELGKVITGRYKDASRNQVRQQDREDLRKGTQLGGSASSINPTGTKLKGVLGSTASPEWDVTKLKKVVRDNPYYEKLQSKGKLKIDESQMIHDISYGRKGSQKILESLATSVGGFSVTSALGAGKGSPHSAGSTGHLSGKGQTYDLSAIGTGMTNTQLGQKLLKSEAVRGGHVIFDGVKYNIDKEGNISSTSKVEGHYDHVDVMLGEQAYEKQRQEENKKKLKKIEENKKVSDTKDKQEQKISFNPLSTYVGGGVSVSPTKSESFSRKLNTEGINE